MSLDATLYVIQATGIGPSGVVGIFSTLQKCDEAAAEILPQTDGYHELEVWPFKVDEVVHGRFPYGSGPHQYDYLENQPIRTYTKDGGRV